MAKRKLSQQQLERIENQQQDYRQRLAEDDSCFKARVVAMFGKSLEVEDEQGQVFQAQPRQNLGSLVCGDEVVCQHQAMNDVAIVALMPRRTLLQRTTRHRHKLIAANVDLMCITLATEPEYHLELLDRYLVAAHHSGIEALIIFNKVDLLDEAARQQVAVQLAGYEELGYPVLYLSAHELEDEGLEQLQQRIGDHTAIFVGQSGVGKSSLLQGLLPGENIETGELSATSRKGTHTTTLSRLYHLPEGGSVIDSPGVRDYVLSHLEEAEVYAGFVELEPYLGHCQFRDCRHDNEPGCAVLQAVAEGKISPQRYASLRSILVWNRTN